MKNRISLFILIGIVIGGFLFRWWGIIDNHSFWADEAYTANVAANFIQGKITLSQIFSIPGSNYQPLHILVMSLFSWVFGVLEFSARLPSIIFGSFGIVFAYLVAYRFTNFGGAVLASFVYAFSQLNLANSTQAKPYTALQTILLIVIYLISIEKKIKNKVLFHLTIIFLLILATLFHVIGILFWFIYFIYLCYSKKKNLLTNLKKPYILLFTFLVLGIIAFPLRGFHLVKNFLLPNQGKFIFLFNNTTYLREMLWKNYGFYFLPAIFGLAIAFKKNKPLVAGIIAWILVLLFMWNFRSYSHNIRYLVPFFGIIFVFFSIFWAKVGQKIFKDKWGIVPFIVLVMIYLGGYKICRMPAKYYSPNADLYGDVQIANYKTMYTLLIQKFPNYRKIAIFNDLLDTEDWYMKRYSNAYFIKNIKKPYPHSVNNIMIYGSLTDFKKEIRKHNKGLLIVEDWESLLPEDIKTYVKKNLKLEIRVDGLPQAQGDNWPLEVYSWENL